MSQQKSKKSSTPWFECEKCFTNIVHKDIDAHSKDCPPNLENVAYNFVKNGRLWGNLDIKTNEDIKNISTKDKEFLVFLSQSVIQLCALSIGEFCCVRFLDSKTAPLARIVWPTTEKSLTSVLLTRSSIESNNLELNQTVSVTKISQNSVKKASIVLLTILNGPKSLEITSELNNRIHKTHLGKLLTAGNKISVMYYGKLLKFQIEEIKTKNEGGDLENCMEQLKIEDSFHKIEDTTKWRLFKDKEEYHKEVSNSKISYRIGGLTHQITEICDVLNCCLKKSSNSLNHSKSVLLYGNSGTGKTLLANFVAAQSNYNVTKISAPDLYSKYASQAEETIKQLFHNAMDTSPSIIILDEVDILCPIRSSRITDLEKRIVSTLLILLDNLNEQNNGKVFVIGTTNKIDSIDPAFRRPGRFDREIEIPTPNPKGRLEILEKLLENVDTELRQEEVKEIAFNTHGFVGADLVSLCSSASLNCVKGGRNRINMKDFKVGLKMVRPSAMREVQIEVPNVKWSDIGGQDNLKLILKQAVEWPLTHADCFVRLGITPPRGVLMFGPPGCSKTMIAKALATESGLNFLSIKGPELFSKWVGESERAVREVFRKARQVAPSIIFFDEIDALGGERSSGSTTSVQERVLAQLLTELDGVTPLGDVTILAATNRPDRIDKALLRPGRLDRIVYVPLPNEDTRREIFRIKLSRMPVSNVSIDDLVKATEGYSGAEVNALCHEAAMVALEEDLNIQTVEFRHFEKAFTLVTPRTPQSLLNIYEDYMKVKI